MIMPYADELIFCVFVVVSCIILSSFYCLFISFSLSEFFQFFAAAIPLINLLIGGGVSACMNIKTNVKACRRIQIVVMKGSGGLADVLADVLSVDSEKDLDKLVPISKCMIV